MAYQFYRQKHKAESHGCPDEETMVCFSEGKLSSLEAQKLERHIVECQRCSQILAILKTAAIEEKEEPSLSLVQRAKDLVKQETTPFILEAIIAIKERALELIQTSANVILGNQIVPPSIVRSRSISEFKEEICLIKEFENLKIILKIEKKEGDIAGLTLEIRKKETDLPLEGVRLVLLKDEIEIESYWAKAGGVFFDNLNFGKYSIQIWQKELLGAINIEIR